MPSEDVLFSVTSRHPALLGVSEVHFAGIRDPAGFGSTAESQTEIIGGVLACRPGQAFCGACAPGFLTRCWTGVRTGSLRLAQTGATRARAVILLNLAFPSLSKPSPAVLTSVPHRAHAAIRRPVPSPSPGGSATIEVTESMRIITLRVR
jgi:hypothetical protein